MSQEKVNKYKEEKANRKQILKKEKRNKIIGRVVSSVVGLVLLGWIGYSAYDSIESHIASIKTEVNLSSIEDYLTELTAEEETTEDKESSEDTKDAEDTDATDDAAGTEDSDNSTEG